MADPTPRIRGMRTWPLNCRMNVLERSVILQAARLADKPPSVYLRDIVLLRARRDIRRAYLTRRQLPRWLPE
jgi:hypothetical protein